MQHAVYFEDTSEFKTPYQMVVLNAKYAGNKQGHHSGGDLPASSNKTCSHRDCLLAIGGVPPPSEVCLSEHTSDTPAI